jgi:hypothetical protein
MCAVPSVAAFSSSFILCLPGMLFRYFLHDPEMVSFALIITGITYFTDQIDKINKNDYIIVAGDYNARVGKTPIDGILGTNSEITINSNGHKLKDFASVNEQKIMNTFFRHKEIHKMTWNAQGY